MTNNSDGSKVENLNGKIALITGGTSGIGFATAELFIREGAKVAIIGRDKERLSESKEKILNASDENLLPVQCDVRKENDIQNAISLVVERLKKIDIVVNNAGITYSAPIEETSLDLSENLNAVNNTGYFLVAREAFENFKKQKTGGVFVFVASDNSLKPSKNSVAYNVSKQWNYNCPGQLRKRVENMVSALTAFCLGLFLV